MSNKNKYFCMYKTYKYKTKILELLNTKIQIYPQPQLYIDNNIIMEGGRPNTQDKNYENLLENESLKTFKIHGATKIFKTTISSVLSINGFLKFDTLNVGRKAVVYGSIKGTNGNFKILTVYGSVHISNSTINKLTIIAPTIDPSVTLNNCIIDVLTIDNFPKKNWHLILNKTTVKKLIVLNHPLKIKLLKNSVVYDTQNALID